MTVEFAIWHIEHRMREMGYDQHFISRWEHIQMSPTTTLTIQANNEYYFLINPSDTIKVRSKKGVFDRSDIAIDKMQYEHTGRIDITNPADTSLLVLFIIAIPNHLK